MQLGYCVTTNALIILFSFILVFTFTYFCVDLHIYLFVVCMSVHVPWHARGGQRTADGSHFFPSLWVQTASLRSKGLYPLSYFISPSVLILQRSKQKISGPNHRLFQGSGIFLSRIKEIQAYVTLQDWFFQLLLSCIWLPQCPPTAGVKGQPIANCCQESSGVLPSGFPRCYCYVPIQWFWSQLFRQNGRVWKEA